jgi:hypothetical protein
MADIVHFVPGAQATAAQTCADFVAMAREQLTVFGPELDFDAVMWDVSDGVAARGHGSKRHRITFSSLRSANSGDPYPMGEPFIAVAKACIRYLQGLRPTQNQQHRLAALRALECALSENGGRPDLSLADAGVFNRAAQLIAENFGDAGAYRVAGQLESIAEIATKYRLTAVPVVGWRSPLKRPGDTVRVGKEFEKRRAARLPSEAALEALPKAYHLAQSLPDRVVTAAAAVLCAAPDRVNELLVLPIDCEVRIDRGPTGQAYGLRWWPSKGAEPMIKWVVPSMAGVAEGALARVRQATNEARRIAEWYERNPRALFLADGTEHLRGERHLSLEELAEVLGLSTRHAADQWCKTQSIEVTSEGRGRRYVSFADVEQAVLSLLPRRFPVVDARTGLTYANALFVVRKNEMHPNRGTYRCMIEPVIVQHINDGLGCGVVHGKSSVFSRLGFTEPDGSPIKVTSHQFRHYLNTLAQAGGLSQLDIAKWSGRKDIRQNAAYDHVAADELLVQVREAIGDDERMRGPLAELPKKSPISRESFAQLQAPTAHTTDFGICLHDFSMLPCQLHRDCINCVEHVCIKGDRARNENVRRRLEEARTLLATAESAKADGHAGADRWTEHHSATVKRLEQLDAILSDPSVPKGTVIQLSTPNMPSPIRNAMDERDRLDGRGPTSRLSPTAKGLLPPPDRAHG